MKIFKIDVGEIDWVCAPDMFSGLKFYEQETGITPMDIENIEEIPYLEWDKHNILDIEAPQDENGNYPVQQTFKEFMVNQTACQIIATTAY